MVEERRVITSSERIPDAQTGQEYQKKKAVYRTYNIIWFLVGIVETLLAFRFVFELLGANPASGFTQLVYTFSYPFAEPFRSIFGITAVGGSVFDWSLIIAAIVYLLLGYGLIQLLRIIRPVTPHEVNEKINTV